MAVAMFANAAAGSAKHRAEAADHHVECTGRELMRLGIAYLVYDVADPLGRCRLTGSLEHALGNVDPDNRPALARAASRVVSPAPQPISSTSFPGLIP
jgi:hypothetical protein